MLYSSTVWRQPVVAGHGRLHLLGARPRAVHADAIDCRRPADELRNKSVDAREVREDAGRVDVRLPAKKEAWRLVTRSGPRAYHRK